MRRPGSAVLAGVLWAAIGGTSGSAQDTGGDGWRGTGCVLDNCADRRPPADKRTGRGDPTSFNRGGPRPRGASRPGEFDFYVLSLSWSPGFCATGGEEKARDQCRSGSGVGFTVHGLWPQYLRGFPSDCRGPTSLPREVLGATHGVYPDEGLARYEWRRHGTCSGLSPTAYFQTVRTARDAVAIPPRFKDPHTAQTVSPEEIARDFIAANPRLHPGMIAAVCRDETLEEVRLCLSKDLAAFETCPEVTRESCRSATIAVPAVR